MEHDFLLRLNHYQAANLRWLLRVAWDCPRDSYPCLNTGDWVGEIPQMLEQAMIEADCTQKPNADDEWAKKPLSGLYGGKKKADYEREQSLKIIERIQELLALKNTPDQDKIRLVEETAKGWWGLKMLRALEQG